MRDFSESYCGAGRAGEHAIAAPVTQFDRAIVRRPSRSVARAIRATNHGEPSYDGVVAEHEAYCSALRAAGVAIDVLPALEGFPDSLFVEDPALVFPEGAIVLRNGASTRSGEAAALAPVLRDAFETVLELPAPGFVDGGDVLTTARKVIIGLSERTDETGARDLARLLKTFDREAEVAKTPVGVLHFKSDCGLVDEDCVLTTARLARSGVFEGFEQIIAPEGEEGAANALRVNDIVFVGATFPRTMEILDKRGYGVAPLSVAEIRKIDAGLSCMSLRWRRPE